MTKKIEIVQWTLNHGTNYRAVAEDFNVSHNRIYDWVRKYQPTGDWEVLKD